MSDDIRSKGACINPTIPFTNIDTLFTPESDPAIGGPNSGEHFELNQSLPITDQSLYNFHKNQILSDAPIDLLRQNLSCAAEPESYLSVVEEMPKPKPPDPALGRKWDEARKAFLKSVKKGDHQMQEKAFAELVNIAILRHHLDDAQEVLEKSRALKRHMEERAGDAKKREFELLFNAYNADPLLDAFNRTKEYGLRLELKLFNSDTIRQQENVIAEREKIRQQSLAALENDLHLALSDVEEKMPIRDGLPREMTLSPMAASLFADIFRSLRDFERAKKYYNAASFNPMQPVAGTAWYRLQALEMDILSKDQKKIKEAIKEIEQIRADLTQLLFLSYDQALNHQESEDTQFPEIPLLTPQVGRPEQVHEVDALSWGILYNAYLKVDGDNKIKLAELDNERRKMVKGRINNATALEARLHLQNLEKMSFVKTVKGGEIEQILRTNGQDESRKAHQDLMNDVFDIEQMVKPHMKLQKGDLYFERFAEVYWRAFFDGYFVRDLPLKAVHLLDEYIIKPRDSMGPVALAEADSVKAHISHLRNVAPQLFTSAGRLDATVDLSETTEGKQAAERVMAAYWKSPDTIREMGLPFGAGVACFAIATPFVETVVVPILAAFACAGGGSLLNREINEIKASEQYHQAAITGISNVTEKEARINRKVWYLSEGMNNVFNAAVFAPMASLWGRVGVAAAKEGILKAGTGLAAKAGGQALLRTAAEQPLKSAGNILKDVGGAIAKGGGWYWKLPIGTRLRLAGLGAAGVDYFFVDRNGNINLFYVNDYGIVIPGVKDRRLDHWWGYAGLAAGMSEGGYQLFRKSWRNSFKELIDSSVIRRGAVRLGADAIAADYYLIKKDADSKFGIEFVDFGAPRDTLIQKYAFEKQFDAFDTPVGIGGLVLFGGNWLKHEWKEMSSADKLVMSGGFTPFAADLLDNGNLDSWYGGVGGSVFIAALGYRLLNVNVYGSMTFLPFKLSYEYLMQVQQDVPPQAPDPKRMMSSTAESIFMMMLVQGTYQGGHYWNTFPLGKNMYAGSERIPVLKNLRCIQDLGRYSFLGNQDIVVPGSPVMLISTGSPAIERWATGSVVKSVNVKKINGKSKGGKAREINYRLRGDKLWDGLAKEHSDVKLRIVEQFKETSNGKPGKMGGQDVYLPFPPALSKGTAESVTLQQAVRNSQVKATEFYINGKPVGREFLEKHGFAWQDGKLWEFKPIRKGTIRIKGRRMTVDEIKSLNDGARSKAIHDIKEQGWRIIGNHFERNWIEHPYHPEVLLQKPAGPLETARYKIIESSIKVDGKEIPVWLKFSRRTVSSEEVIVGGKEKILWTGQREKPRFTLTGIGMQFLPVLAEAGLTNFVIFRRTSSGDPIYQPLQRVWNYGPTVLFTWPVIQARSGLDSPKGRALGALIGYGPNLMGNWIFPSYRNTAPGQVSMYNHLDKGDADKSFRSFGRIVTSLNPMPWGPAYGTSFEIEPKAMDNLLDGLDCRMDLAKGADFGKSNKCISLPPATQRQIIRTEKDLQNKMKGRFDTWAKAFHDKMETERKSDLSERERRLLIVMGAWFKSLIYNPEYNEKGDETLSAVKEVVKEYQWFFDKLPPKLTSEQNWKDFISQVNAGRSNASNFYELLL